jgi:serine/threonine protein phosphatase 1
MTERLIAIGDIHGCKLALDRLLDSIEPTAQDTIVTLGDYVDRGPDSRGVIDRLIQLGGETQHIGLMGNHEEMMLAVIQHQSAHDSWLQHGGVDTLDSYGFGGSLDFLPDSHLEFFESLRDFHEDRGHFFTHAAYAPKIPLEEQAADMLRWHSLNDVVPTPHLSGKIAVVGHTANKDGEILHLGHLICIDTFCYGGGWLTALDLCSGQTWQASKEGEMRD